MIKIKCLLFQSTILAIICLKVDAIDVTPKQFKCEEGNCLVVPFDGNEKQSALSKDACKTFCHEYANLLPRPTGEFSIGSVLAHVNLNSIDVELLRSASVNPHIQGAISRFKKQILDVIPPHAKALSGGRSVIIYLQYKSPNVQSLTLETDESYTLTVSVMSDGRLNATISADNFFGARHGLETLSQLFIYDDIRNELQLVGDIHITDKPVYPYRGILLDTSRSFHPVQSIKRLIDGMAMVKLNTFHWHITDSHSFPFQSKSRPELTEKGAYSPEKVYTIKDMKEIVQYALERGVRVLPEFDAPAHVGEGWQDTDYLVCFKKEPWSGFCAEPPCGQFNPAKEGLYDVLQDIYSDMLEIFKPDMFHMGGDEVNEKCWLSVDEIKEFMVQNRWEVNQKGVMQLWDYFQKKAAERVYKANKGEKMPLVLWTSTLTQEADVTKYLNPNDYIIQVWTTGTDPQIQHLLSKGYKLIFSNYDALYLDCGFATWIGFGNNWCSPYKGWQTVYENSPAKMAGAYFNQTLGGEAALWTEQSDDSTMDSRVWPRGAALAERLWAEPTTDWLQAESRMLSMRERFIKKGIKAELIQPEWCYNNEGSCIRK